MVIRCGLRNQAAGVNSRPFDDMEVIIQKNSVALQYDLPGCDKLEGSVFLAIPLWPQDSAKAEQVEETLVSKVGENKRGTSQGEVPLFVWFGSPGRTRTCDQPVTSSPIFQPGLDYLFTRLHKKQGRVSGASEALLDGFRSL